MSLATLSIERYHLDLIHKQAQGQASEVILTATAQALSRSNAAGSGNTYLWQDAAWTKAEATHVAEIDVPGAQAEFDKLHTHPILWGVPVSVKDCFDLAGAPTTCGTVFYREHNGIAAQDSWLVERLRNAGAIITGKTHLHPLAYGITGENAEFGDCLQPGDPDSLTGGSSSGAAASVLEGSAMAAIGTDTGGSIRVPAALCGLAGYRASLGIGDWSGAAHLAPSFDTMGWIFRSLEDGLILAKTLDINLGRAPSKDPSEKLKRTFLMKSPKQFAAVSKAFLSDCEPAVVESLEQCQLELEALGMTATTVEIDWWSDSLEIFAAIQASEAAVIHRGHYHQFEPSIRQRLEWGASLDREAVAALRQRHKTFRDRMDALLDEHHFLLMPAAPVTRLRAGVDHSQTRTRLLRYTTPVSLAGMPAITVPYFKAGLEAGGMQIAAARGDDDRLLALADMLGERRRRDLESDQPVLNPSGA